LPAINQGALSLNNVIRTTVVTVIYLIRGAKLQQKNGNMAPEPHKKCNFAQKTNMITH